MEESTNSEPKIDWSIYHKLHRRKVALGGLGALLVAGIFASVFLGFMRVEVGREMPGDLGKYHLFPGTIYIAGSSTPFLIGYEDRSIPVDPTTNQTQEPLSTNDQNDLVLINMHSGTAAWHFSVSKPSFVMNPDSIDVLTSDNDSASTPVTTASIFCQFCQVAGANTTAYKTSSGQQIDLIKNDTGYYETYLLTASTTACNAYNLTAQIKGCVVTTTHLSYNPADNLPDFLVLTANNTWNQLQTHSQINNPGFTLYAMYANGTVAWSARQNQTGSIFYTTNPALNGFYGFAQINRTCDAVIAPNYSIVAFDLRTGKTIWSRGYEMQSDYNALIRTDHDYNGDGTADIVVIRRYQMNDTMAAGFISGATGTNITSIGILTLGKFDNAKIANFNCLRRFPDVKAEFLAGWVRSAEHLLIWNITATGIHATGVMDYSGKLSNDSNYMSVDPALACEYDGKIYGFVNYNTASNNPSVIESIDLSTAKTVDIVQARSSFGVFGIFDTFEAPGIQYAYTVDRETTALGIIVMGSRHFLFLESPMDTIELIVSMIVAGLCTLGIYVVERSRKKLYQQVNANVAPENAEVSGIIRPLRIAGMLIVGVLVVSCVIFFIFVFTGQTNNFVLGSGDYTVITGGYITFAIMFGGYPLVAVLNNHFSPHSGILYIKLQRAFYKIFKRKRDFRIIVLAMPYARKHSFAAIFMRSLFPVLIALTVGLWLFTSRVSPGLSPMTASGIDMTWMSQFQLYGSSIFVLIYFLLVFIIPGGWLLDDAGVVYFDEPKSQLQPGDISKVSNWLTTLLKGVFGVTAILNYYRLFVGIDFSKASTNNGPVMGLLMSIFVIGIYLVFSPIMYGIMVNLRSNASMISDLEYNRNVLYEKMAKAGLDVTPYHLRDFFDRRPAE